MFLKRRRLKKEDRGHRGKLIFIGCLLINFFLALFLLFYLNIHLNIGYISPLSIGKDSFVSKVQKNLENSKISTDRVSLNSDNSVSINLKDGGEVIFSSKIDIKSQIASLQLMLSKLTIEGKRLKTLDFRYENPVVSFK